MNLRITDVRHYQGPSGLSFALFGDKKKRPKTVNVASPYLESPEAAAYLRITTKALYGLVERRKLRPLPGHRRYRFTKDMLDKYLRGE